jgi:hypothetical protein
MLENNEILAKQWESMLHDVIALNSKIEGDEDDYLIFDGIDHIDNYERKGILTQDKGLVITLEDGSEINITIQAYKERR